MGAGVAKARQLKKSLNLNIKYSSAVELSSLEESDNQLLEDRAARLYMTIEVLELEKKVRELRGDVSNVVENSSTINQQDDLAAGAAASKESEDAITEAKAEQERRREQDAEDASYWFPKSLLTCKTFKCAMQEDIPELRCLLLRLKWECATQRQALRMLKKGSDDNNGDGDGDGIAPSSHDKMPMDSSCCALLVSQGAIGALLNAAGTTLAEMVVLRSKQESIDTIEAIEGMSHENVREELERLGLGRLVKNEERREEERKEEERRQAEEKRQQKEGEWLKDEEAGLKEEGERKEEELKIAQQRRLICDVITPESSERRRRRGEARRGEEARRRERYGAEEDRGRERKHTHRRRVRRVLGDSMEEAGGKIEDSAVHEAVHEGPLVPRLPLPESSRQPVELHGSHIDDIARSTASRCGLLGALSEAHQAHAARVESALSRLKQQQPLPPSENGQDSVNSKQSVHINTATRIDVEKCDIAVRGGAAHKEGHGSNGRPGRAERAIFRQQKREATRGQRRERPHRQRTDQSHPAAPQLQSRTKEYDSEDDMTLPPQMKAIDFRRSSEMDYAVAMTLHTRSSQNYLGLTHSPAAGRSLLGLRERTVESAEASKVQDALLHLKHRSNWSEVVVSTGCSPISTRCMSWS
jgi:hypothetical protein